MIFPIFTTFVIFSAMVFIYMKKTQSSINIVDDGFWEKEHEANRTRKKNLDNIVYYEIPFDKLPFDDDVLKADNTIADKPLADELVGNNSFTDESVNSKSVIDESVVFESKILECQNTILSLKGKKIANLNGITNTDLKLEYGVANLTALSEYDDNYVVMSKALSEWADLLITLGKKASAIPILEFAVETGSDIKSVYVNLADIYAENGDFQKIEDLVAKVEKLDSIMKNPILKELHKRSLISPSYL